MHTNYQILQFLHLREFFYGTCTLTNFAQLLRVMSKVSAVAVLYHRYGGRRVWGEGRGRVRGGGVVG